MRDAAVTVRVARRDELAWFADWAAAEGWNPGPTDMGCFAAEDPAGFFLGLAGGVPVAAISVVNYGAAFAFLGFYIVSPEARGRGFGLATWRAALPHAGQRVVGLDGVVAQQANYARSGFVLAYRNIRYGGTPARAGRLDPAVVVPDATLDAALGAYDGTCFPAPRPRFLAAWTRAPGHVVRALVRDGALAGYGVARPCREGVKIGPLFADTRA
ncbi:MAG: GNAT family N-acetyltransferase, partial [Proteobacteria bacterium]|nr:GNAT family N-acetyltransferase [Pseudomonadota bacterium]